MLEIVASTQANLPASRVNVSGSNIHSINGDPRISLQFLSVETFVIKKLQIPGGREALSWITYGKLNIGLILRAIAELLQASQACNLFGVLLVLSAILQWLSGVAFWILPRFRSGLPRGNIDLVWRAFVILNMGIVMVAVQPFFSMAWLTQIGRILETISVLLFVLASRQRAKPLEV